MHIIARNPVGSCQPILHSSLVAAYIGYSYPRALLGGLAATLPQASKRFTDILAIASV